MEVVADREASAKLLEQQDEREGEQHLVEVLAGVEVAKQPALERRGRRGVPPSAATGRANQSEPLLRVTRNAT